MGLSFQSVAFFAEVAQLAAVTALALEIEGDAGIERLGVDVKTDAARGRGVLNLMNGLELVDHHYACAFGAVDGADFIDLELGGAAQAVDVDDVLVFGSVAAGVVVLVRQNFALGDGHPSEL